VTQQSIDDILAEAYPGMAEIMEIYAISMAELEKALAAMNDSAWIVVQEFANAALSLFLPWVAPRPPLSFMQYYEKQAARRARKRKHRRP
jgi:hypothetical protein